MCVSYLVKELKKANILTNRKNESIYQLLNLYTFFSEENSYRQSKELITLYGDHIFNDKKITFFNTTSDAVTLSRELTHLKSLSLFVDKKVFIEKAITYLSTLGQDEYFELMHFIKHSLKPHRIALHEMIVSVSTQLQLEDDTELHRIVIMLSDSLSEEIKIIAQKAEQERVQKYKNLIKGLSDSNETMCINYPEVIDCMLVKLKNIDMLYYENVCQEFRDMVEKGIRQLVYSKPEIKFVEIPAQKERLTFIQSGGIASGKSSLMPILKESVKQYKIDWKNIIKISADSYNFLLLAPNLFTTKRYSQMVLYESCFVKRLIQNRLLEMVKNAKAPHVLFDQVNIIPQQLFFSLLGDGQVEIFVISTEVCDAISRAYSRGKEMGRYVSPAVILKSHKSVVDNMIKNLALFDGEKISVTLMDNNVEKYAPPDLVMLMNMHNRTFHIFNENKLYHFFKKTLINTNATTEEEVYFIDSPSVVQQHLELLNKKGFSGTFFNSTYRELDEKETSINFGMLNSKV